MALGKWFKMAWFTPGDLFEFFIGRFFTNPITFIGLVLAIIWIWWRLKQRRENNGRSSGYSGGGGSSYKLR